MKLCVFQGTFNPIHNAHLAMANYIKTVYSYDSILFVPAYKPPHKEIDDDLANHRFDMVKLAVTGDSSFGISNIEFQNERYSYTYLTIVELYKRYKIEGKIGFIIGLDAFEEIDTWYETDKLKKMVLFLVFLRGPITTADKERLSLLHFMGYDYIIVKMVPVDISSTEIRGKIARGNSVSGLVPSSVVEYIRQNELYKEQ